MVFNRHQGLKLPAGSIPKKFTIFSRAKYVKETEMSGELTKGQLITNYATVLSADPAHYTW